MQNSKTTRKANKHCFPPSMMMPMRTLEVQLCREVDNSTDTQGERNSNAIPHSDPISLLLIDVKQTSHEQVSHKGGYFYAHMKNPITCAFSFVDKTILPWLHDVCLSYSVFLQASTKFFFFRSDGWTWCSFNFAHSTLLHRPDPGQESRHPPQRNLAAGSFFFSP